MLRLVLIIGVIAGLIFLPLAVAALNYGQTPIVAYIDADQPGETDLYIADLSRNLRIRLTRDDLHQNEFDWSPDGKSIVFSAIQDEQLRLYRYDLGVGVSRFPINDYANIPQWSPDGQRVLYVHEPMYGNAALRIYDLENETDVEFADLVFGFTDATWSPDGTQIAYAEIIQQDQPLRLQIQRLDDPDKSQLRTVAEGLERVSAIAWSPDGRTLACLCISRGLPLRGQHIILIDVETMEQKSLVEANTRQFRPGFTWSADGEYILTYNIF